jgi:hypothetical protein
MPRFDAKRIPSIHVPNQEFNDFTATDPPIGSIIVYRTSHEYDEFDPSYSFGRVVSRARVDPQGMFDVKLHHTFGIERHGNNTSILFYKEPTIVFSEHFDDLVNQWFTLDALKDWKTTPRAAIDHIGLNRLLLSIPPSEGIPSHFHDSIKEYFDGDHYNHDNEVAGLLETHELASYSGAMLGEIPLSVIDVIARILSGHAPGHLTSSVLGGREVRLNKRIGSPTSEKKGKVFLSSGALSSQRQCI